MSSSFFALPWAARAGNMEWSTLRRGPGKQKKLHTKSWIKTFVLSALGFAYSLWAIYGSGSETGFYGFLLILIGIPVYIYMKWIKNKED